MFKVLLVDDERIILEGISQIVPWTSSGAELIGTARNGLEALTFIEEQQPDIIISDIKMPGMDGLQLVERVKELYPQIAFILLSGFSEFDYARTAMAYGVKHYLLKPCNETKITEALIEVIEDLQTQRTQHQFVQTIQSELTRVLPHAKAQFLKELVTNKTYGKRDWDTYRRMFHITHDTLPIRLILMQVEGMFEYEHIFALTNIAEEKLGEEIVLLSTTIGRHVLLLIQETEQEEQLFSRLSGMKCTFTDFYKLETTIAVSGAGEITDARKMYRETLECLNFRFHVGEGAIITPQDLSTAAAVLPSSFDYDEEQLGMELKAGNWEAASEELARFFQLLADQRMDTVLTKSYVIPLFVSISRQSAPDRLNDYLQMLARLDELETLKAIEAFVRQAAKDICEANFDSFSSKQSTVIKKMIEVIASNLADPALSLNWVANEILYMNADYLGKLFKKETGERFSAYVMKLRVEKAMEEIMRTEDVKVFELAERFGFGDNPQYFSQVFKKHTGYTPSDYKRSL
ncbi:DNA-binding response regulator [Paenibacillus sp. BIHB 4019]|uniref:DNA-binding response regulator n=1 Tax=Paenibacillus sp. BIHB 4019 TaxID=1870819 RepID=A0A1B2DN61_9BACL|nr:response regulator transcription factor [Paenibacillus sp. BIHB 4019]ANY69150.1 DNA-binding response regulator [Paenibacillus sp. BIHB 4019]